MFFLISGKTLFSQSNDSILGVWYDKDHPQKQVRFFKQHGLYSAKAYVSGDNKNMIIFKNLRWNVQTSTYNGSIVDPDNGKEYEIEVVMSNNDEFTFSVGVFIFSKTFIFKRVK